MLKDSYDFLVKMLETPSPSGFEQEVQKVVKRRLSAIADEIAVDVHGNLMACFNPQGKVRVMLAGHCDQIGMMVTHIDDKGFIYFDQIGGLDPSVLPGTEVVIQSRDGAVEGVIGHPPVHLIEPADRGKKTEMFKLWIDIGAADGKEANNKVAVGDPITFRLGVRRLGRNIISSPACDDKVGVYVIAEALRIVASRVKARDKKKFPVALYAVSTVQEEVGLRGARTSCFGIDPLVGIAVDVTHASDNPGAEPKRIGTMRLGMGPSVSRGANINPVLENLIVETAKKKRIKFQPQAAPRATGTDANVIQVSRSGVAAGLIGIPNRYMHTPVEMVDLRDLDAAAKLIAETVLAIRPRMSFIPA